MEENDMGAGKIYNCKKCGYEFTEMNGIGYLFPMEYQECIEKGRNGEYGDEIKNFLAEHPDGALNCEKISLVCEDCNELMTDYDFTMYLPKKNIRITKDSYFMPDELKAGFAKYKDYNHKCEKCGGSMCRLNSRKTLKCPDCGELLETSPNLLMWD